jgi:hydroxymethylpyrimidine/phosphomethylpyrimidine kinase
LLRSLRYRWSVTAVALTIAGSDPSGGAGIQADLATFHQFGVYGLTALTLLTVQNTQRVSRVETVPADFVLSQIAEVVSDIPPGAAKTGALGSLEIVEGLAEMAGAFPFPLVIDPVLVSTHGSRLLARDAESALKNKLLPCARLVTPNIPEAQLLTGVTITNETDLRRAAHLLLNFGCQAVLIKGGHSSGEPVDYLLDENGWNGFPGKRIKTAHTHGTGCVYSAAITACLALGYEAFEAVAIARDFIQRAIETAPGLGAGRGPVNSFAPVCGLAAGATEKQKGRPYLHSGKSGQ